VNERTTDVLGVFNEELADPQPQHKQLLGQEFLLSMREEWVTFGLTKSFCFL